MKYYMLDGNLRGYEVDRNAPLPTGEPVDKLIYEAYPEDYRGPKE